MEYRKEDPMQDGGERNSYTDAEERSQDISCATSKEGIHTPAVQKSQKNNFEKMN